MLDLAKHFSPTVVTLSFAACGSNASGPAASPDCNNADGRPAWVACGSVVDRDASDGRIDGSIDASLEDSSETEATIDDSAFASDSSERRDGTAQNDAGRAPCTPPGGFGNCQSIFCCNGPQASFRIENDKCQCLRERCEELPEGAACDDRDPCTSSEFCTNGDPSFTGLVCWHGDACRGGVCVGGERVRECSILYSDPATGYVHRIDPDGSNDQQLTTFAASSPRWSRDRSRIAFVSDGDLYTVSPRGDSLARITTGQTFGKANNDGVVSWGPFPFQDSMVTSGWCDGLGLSECCHIVDVNTGSTKLLTIPGHERGTPGFALCTAPDWGSPGGSASVVFRTPGNPPMGNQFWTTPDVFQLHEYGYGSLHPRWSPDGRYLVFHDSNGGIVVATIQGGIRATIATGYNPTWSPDGSAIAYWMGHGIYADDEGPRLVTMLPSFPIAWVGTLDW
jgi:hypothetical protein